MISAVIYYPLYLLLVTILTTVIYSKYNVRNSLHEPSTESPVATLILVVIVTLFIGLRPLSGKYFVDMANYNLHYYTLYYGISYTFTWDTENFLFDNYFRWLGSLNIDIYIFFFTMALIYFGAAYWGIRRLFPNHTMAAYLVFLGAFSTFSYSTNGFKAGAAASVFILAISYWKKWKYCVPLMIVSLGLHHSMKMPIAAFAIAYYFKNPKLYFYGWFACLLLSLAHVTFFQELFSSMADDSENYLDITGEEAGNAKAGFRPDFILYSAMPILVGYYAIFQKKLAVSNTYRVLLYTYITTNAVWMLCMYASFTNRIAYLSWLLYPVVLIYPFLKENWGATRYQTFAKVMLAHLGFTIFMEGIYYGSLFASLK